VWTRSFRDHKTVTKKDFYEAIVNTRNDLHKMVDLRTQGTQSEIEAMKTLVDTTHRGLKAKIAEVIDDFLKGLKTARHELKTQLSNYSALTWLMNFKNIEGQTTH
jgi:hypothetical protein